MVGEPPFKEGDTVWVKGGRYLGAQTVISCEWFDRTNPGVPAYWLCQCAEQRDIDWANIPQGAVGIIMPGLWSGSADYLELVS